VQERVGHPVARVCAHAAIACRSRSISRSQTTIWFQANPVWVGSKWRLLGTPPMDTSSPMLEPVADQFRVVDRLTMSFVRAPLCGLCPRVVRTSPTLGMDVLRRLSQR
jgi:hypothetical protein